jgi:hypothetical protein
MRWTHTRPADDSVLGLVGRIRFMAWPQKGRYSPHKSAKLLSESQRRRILRRYLCCQLCFIAVRTRYSVEVHYVIDVADRGTDHDDNLRGVCKECHTWISARNSAARSKTARRSPTGADPGPRDLVPQLHGPPAIDSRGQWAIR